jgi:hypothetical protein
MGATVKGIASFFQRVGQKQVQIKRTNNRVNSKVFSSKIRLYPEINQEYIIIRLIPFSLVYYIQVLFLKYTYKCRGLIQEIAHN